VLVGYRKELAIVDGGLFSGPLIGNAFMSCKAVISGSASKGTVFKTSARIKATVFFTAISLSTWP
jgi:hypothetical protein